MQVSLKDKVALVTGGSRGIGRACAVALARAGAQVAFTYAGNEAAAKDTVAEVEKLGGKARAYKSDAGDTKACAELVDQVVKELGRLDVLVNNAGVAIDGLVMRVKDEDWDRQLDTNLKGAFALIRAASRPMMKQRGGSIVNLTSVVGEMGNGGQSAYSASKAGLIGLTKSVARELASRNIRCNAVSPGFIDTDMTAKIPPDTRVKMVEGIPLARLGAAEDVANAVTFLASDLAGYITGEVLKVNGGMYM
ncbi:MAG TPA: 3-oxoacyl-[acyl-carrier-protein] reductase [Myxococcaceae bacterium]|nr:3-oxoacyl-[acyl-carrier-protein] reductase [Myxococcaceae bacterium]